jgi:hypothetical protein
VAVADVPNIDAFSLVTSVQAFTPSAEAEALVTQQVQLLKDLYGAEGQEIIDDAQAYADGVNAYWAANNVNQPPATVNDVVAVTAFIGSIFGAGGGAKRPTPICSRSSADSSAPTPATRRGPT